MISGRFLKRARRISFPAKRETPIVVAMSPGSDQPRVFELLPVVFDLLAVTRRLERSGHVRQTPEVKALIQDLTSHGLLEVRRENLHHRQVSAHPGRRQHAHLQGRACPCGARPRGTRRHQRKRGTAAVPHAHAAGGLGALRGAVRHRIGDGTLDGPGRPLSVYIPMASPFVSKLAAIAARVHSESPFDVIYSHYLEPYGVAAYLAAQMVGAPHVARMAGSDAGRLWHHPQLEMLYDHVLRSAEVVIAAGKVAERAIQRGVAPDRIALAANSCCRKTYSPRTVLRSTSRHCGRRSSRPATP